MFDLLSIISTVVLFGIALVYVHASEALKERRPNA
ncbi:hypothetical protein HDF17_002802 [Granulicella arctica]|uniref:Uncharacterized protein n=1 Tax=Granulicella arctica TaxID=940613 RepID=A0A7Y9PIF1_9BACT|nr:hypothetical protein [Granulicella arctica]